MQLYGGDLFQIQSTRDQDSALGAHFNLVAEEMRQTDKWLQFLTDICPPEHQQKSP